LGLPFEEAHLILVPLESSRGRFERWAILDSNQ
jgi:hypothetical protein